jgi:RHS repeat-associated protein
MYRGYTGHEHLYGFADIPGLDLNNYYGCDYFVRPHDAFNLINMNGRLYDPVNGRMLSVDEAVQGSLGTQGFNKYTYAGNNPLKYTDPSGEVIGVFGSMAIGAAMGVITNGIQNTQAGQEYFKGAGKAAFKGAVFGGLTFGAGEIFQGAWVAQALAHGVIGGIQSSASGGSFRSGFMSGVVSSGVSTLIGAAANVLEFNTTQKVVSMILAGGLSGGIASRMSGGNFIDGAKQGLMTSALNHGLHMAGEGIADAMKEGGDPVWGNAQSIPAPKEKGEKGYITVSIGSKKFFGYVWKNESLTFHIPVEAQSDGNGNLYWHPYDGIKIQDATPPGGQYAGYLIPNSNGSEKNPTNFSFDFGYAYGKSIGLETAASVGVVTANYVNSESIYWQYSGHFFISNTTNLTMFGLNSINSTVTSSTYYWWGRYVNASFNNHPYGVPGK